MAHRAAGAVEALDEATLARLELIAEAGRLPQLETPERLATDVWDFAVRPGRALR